MQASKSLSQGSFAPDDALDGIKAVDAWECGPYATMLFTVDEGANLGDTNEPAFYGVYPEREPEGWRASSGGTLTFENLHEPSVGFSPGLHEIFRTSGGAIRPTWAFATPQVALVRLTPDGNSLIASRAERVL